MDTVTLAGFTSLDMPRLDDGGQSAKRVIQFQSWAASQDINGELCLPPLRQEEVTQTNQRPLRHRVCNKWHCNHHHHHHQHHHHDKRSSSPATLPPYRHSFDGVPRCSRRGLRQRSAPVAVLTPVIATWKRARKALQWNGSSRLEPR